MGRAEESSSPNSSHGGHSRNSLRRRRNPPDKGAPRAPGSRAFLPASPSPGLGEEEESGAQFLERTQERVPQTNSPQRNRLPSSLQRSRTSRYCVVSFGPDTAELGTASCPRKRTLQSRFWPSAIPLRTSAKDALGPQWTGSLWKRKFPLVSKDTSDITG